MKLLIFLICSLLITVTITAKDQQNVGSKATKIVVNASNENPIPAFSVTLYLNDNKNASFAIQDTSFTLDLQMESYKCIIDKISGKNHISVKIHKFYNEHWISNLSASSDSIIVERFEDGQMTVEGYDHK